VCVCLVCVLSVCLVCVLSVCLVCVCLVCVCGMLDLPAQGQCAGTGIMSNCPPRVLEWSFIGERGWSLGREGVLVGGI